MLSTVSVILPAAIIVIAGFVAGRRVLDPAGIKALSDLCFLLFLPCLLFRSMATARFEGSDLTLLAVYFGASLLWFFCVALFSRNNGKQTTAPITHANQVIISGEVLASKGFWATTPMA